MAIRQDIEGYTGSDVQLNFTIYVPGTTQADIDANTAQKQNITGYTFAFQFRLGEDANTALFEKTIGSGINVTNAAQGALTVTVSRADTQTLAGGDYFYELARTNNGNYTVETAGTFTLRRGLR